MRSLHRLVPQRDFPSYSHVPDKTPHPISHPQGHSYQLPSEEVSAVTLENWRNSTSYLYGFDLFNYGYYWEAHEVWEGVWNANERTGAIAIFLKGLIKLAAAGVKVREGKPNGLLRHSQRAAECFAEVQESFDKTNANFLGFSLDTLVITCEKMRRMKESQSSEDLQNQQKHVPVEIIFDFILIPQL